VDTPFLSASLANIQLLCERVSVEAGLTGISNAENIASAFESLALISTNCLTGNPITPILIFASLAAGEHTFDKQIDNDRERYRHASQIVSSLEQEYPLILSVLISTDIHPLGMSPSNR